MKNLFYNTLVFIQFFCIFYIFLSGKVITLHLPVIITESLGLCIGIWSVFAMNPGNLNISPAVKSNNILVSRGPYKLIRHPMYLSILLVSTPMVIYDFTLIRLIILLILLSMLLTKIFIEEKLLLSVHTNYKTYKKKTWRLVPFLF